MFAKHIKTILALIILLFATIGAYGQEDKKDESQDQSEIVEKTETDKISAEDRKDSILPKKETINKDSETPKLDETSAKKQTERRRRIITAEELKKRRSPIGDFLMKPFRSIAPVVTDRVTTFEEDKQYLLLFGVATLPISPTFGGVTEDSGFGVGFTASTRDYISKDFRVVGSSLATTEKYARTNLGVEITPQKFKKSDLTIKLIGEQLLLAEEDFYGSGADSIQGDETSFYQRQIGAKLSVEFEPSENFEIGAFSEFTKNDITESGDSSIVISERFNSQTLPGLERNISLLETGAFIESKFLDEEDNPHSGFSTIFSFSNVDSPGSKDLGWQNYGIDARTYIPLGNKLRVIALRFLGDFKETKGNSAIPFFRLARLGTGETLRGYDTYRFQGRNSMHLNAEYRFKLMQGFETSGFTGVEGVFFGDFGQVYNRYNELNSKNIRATWGGGFRVTTVESVVLTILYAQSPEKGGIIWRFGRSF